MPERRAGSDLPRVEPESLADWRAWLQANHVTSGSVWLVLDKKAAGRVRLAYEEAAVEAVAFGWIDSLPRKLDETRTLLLVSPRKAGSAWSAVNKARAERAEAEGRMTAAGRDAIARSKADGGWSKLDAVETLTLPDDLEAALAARPPARAAWDGFPRSVKRGVLEWIAQAKGADTRARRVTETAERAARGERANQWRKA